MNSLLRKQFACLLVGVATVVCAAHGAAQGARPGSTDVTPVPKVSGPVPISSDSVPFLAADRNLEPTDLKKRGYVEEEFIVTGTANVYDWAADGSLTVKTPNVPYGTRVLVRRPADPGRFSGDVVVEPLNTVRRNDWSWMWGYLGEQILQRGDAWVGITLPSSSQALKKFNAARYAAVSFPNPTPTPCTTGGNNTAVSEIEDGLKWESGWRAAQEQRRIAAAGGIPCGGAVHDGGPKPGSDGLHQRDPFACESREWQVGV
jgi:hypothetical protein